MKDDRYLDLIATVVGTFTTTAQVHQAGQVNTFPHHMTQAESVTLTQLLLATRIPWLCPDCHGKGEYRSPILEPDEDGPTHLAILCLRHPNAPTIAKLLAIGEAVMTADVGDGCVNMPGWGASEYVSTVFEALRAVEPNE